MMETNNSFKPAPSQYDSFKGSFNNPTRSIVFGSSDRKDLTETEKTPGPNYYSAEKAKDFRDTSNPRCKMGGEFRNTDFKKG